MNFTPTYQPACSIEKNSLCLLFDDDALWILNTSANIPVPEYSQLPTDKLTESQTHYIGLINQQSVFLIHGTDTIKLAEATHNDKLTRAPLRELFTNLSADLSIMINLAYHIYLWEKNSRYCGHCGSTMQFMPDQRGKNCSKCEHTVYPLVMPCIIVSVIKDNKSILLAEINHKNSCFQSVLAGFIEAGETLEQAVAREVQEEVGISIKNLTYYGSQPWSFSQSLMVAFTAEYNSGEIQVDGKEIEFADWYSADKLPELPPEYSIARQMIEDFRNTY